MAFIGSSQDHYCWVPRSSPRRSGNCPNLHWTP